VYQTALAEQIRINDLKTHFLSVVAHEFRNPLAVMKIAAWFLRSPEDTLSASQRSDKLDQINNQIERLNRLVADVSTAYKLQSSNFQITFGIVDVVRVVRDAARDVEELSITDLEIRFEMPASLLVYTDEQLFSHIVTNLLSNAMKYSPDGKTVTVVLQMVEGWLNLSVRDQGIGIPEDDQVKLFELFHRGQNTGTIKGTGLGLAIVKYCVDALGGRIHWESKVGEGTTFAVSIPMDRADHAP
jgi:signal transduction histidine kinase